MTDVGKKKLKYSLWSLLYLALTAIIVVSGTSLFNNFYYESVYVNGSSMSPTFDGEGEQKAYGSDYGIIDKSNGAKRSLKRYQIVTTYYPTDPEDRDRASYKIKRVIVKPGETFKIVDNSLYLKHGNSWSESLEMPFKRKGVDVIENDEHASRNYPETTLKDNEYFLAGDNWVHSSDSFNIGPIKYDLLVGVVVKMQGKCTVKNGKVTEKQSYEDRYFLGVDY